VLSTDQDYLVYSYDLNFDSVLTAAGYVPDIPGTGLSAGCSIPQDVNGNPMTEFMSWRKGDINLIVANGVEFYLKHQTAGYICKKLNILDKDDRIIVYHAIMHGRWIGDGPKWTIGAENPTPPAVDYFAINRMF
jgi:hypothetical protein